MVSIMLLLVSTTIQIKRIRISLLSLILSFNNAVPNLTPVVAANKSNSEVIKKMLYLHIGRT